MSASCKNFICLGIEYERHEMIMEIKSREVIYIVIILWHRLSLIQLSKMIEQRHYPYLVICTERKLVTEKITEIEFSRNISYSNFHSESI